MELMDVAENSNFYSMRQQRSMQQQYFHNGPEPMDSEKALNVRNSSQSPLQRELKISPKVLEGVASAYRYKLTIENEELLRSSFKFSDDLDVFSFNDVDKKRALKKEEWPIDAVPDPRNPNQYEIKLQLMAGNVEIHHCDGCAKWKDKTRKPFLVLTPSGKHCVQFVKNPFVLLIFRCCPKFHSCSKQFRLVITLTCPATNTSFFTEINIHRKKFVSNKKRKQTDSPKEDISPPSSPSAPHTLPNTIQVRSDKASTTAAPSFVKEEGVEVKKRSICRQEVKGITCKIPEKVPIQRQFMPPVDLFPNFPYIKTQQNAASVVSPQFVYEMLYKSKDAPSPSSVSSVCGPLSSAPVTHVHNIAFPTADTHPLTHPIKQQPQQQPTAPHAAPQVNLSIPPTFAFAPSFWNFDAFPDANNDEKWLESVFTDLEDANKKTTDVVDSSYLFAEQLPWTQCNTYGTPILDLNMPTYFSPHQF